MAEAVGASPEFDDCARAAAASDVPTKDVYESAAAAAHQLLLALVEGACRPSPP